MEHQHQAFEANYSSYGTDICSMQSEFHVPVVSAAVDDTLLLQQPTAVAVTVPAESVTGNCDKLTEMSAEAVPVQHTDISGLENGSSVDGAVQHEHAHSTDITAYSSSIETGDATSQPPSKAAGTDEAVEESCDNSIPEKQSATLPHHTDIEAPACPSVPFVQEKHDHSLAPLPRGQDYGASVALEDFGGEFEDGAENEELPSAPLDIFSDSHLTEPISASTSAAAESESSHVVTSQTLDAPEKTSAVEPDEEQLEVPAVLDRIPVLPANEEPLEIEDGPPVLEKEVASKATVKKLEDVENGDVHIEQSSPDSKKSLRHSVGTPKSDHVAESNMELNVNSRPRRSVNRKSVFELLHVEYRHVGGPRKAATPRSADTEVDHATASKKQRSAKKSSADVISKSNKSVENHHDEIKTSIAKPSKGRRLLPFGSGDIEDIDSRINVLKHKVVSYRPDDFDIDADCEPDNSAKTAAELEKENASKTDSDRQVLQESIFSEADDKAARLFLSTFEAESVEALSAAKHAGEEGSSGLDMLLTENQALKSRIKALEQSKQLVKKFNIDFHGRKFSRVRSPAFSLPGSENRKLGSAKVDGSLSENRPVAEQQSSASTSGESILSRVAMLDRREHKLRELSAELDERSTAVKIGEGALQRKERKLIDYEKTLEHRERVLSRHEQSILRRELVLDTPAACAADGNSETTEDRQSLAAEVQRRLEQRRLELDRRQAALAADRGRLEARERELDQREAGAKVAQDSREDKSSGDDDDDRDENTPQLPRPQSKPVSQARTNKRRKSLSHSIRSKYLSPQKQQKVSPAASKTAAGRRLSLPAPRRKIPASGTKDYVLRKR